MCVCVIIFDNAIYEGFCKLDYLFTASTPLRKDTQVFKSFGRLFFCALFDQSVTTTCYICVLFMYIYIYIIYDSKSLDVVQSLYFGSKLPSSYIYILYIYIYTLLYIIIIIIII